MKKCIGFMILLTIACHRSEKRSMPASNASSPRTQSSNTAPAAPRIAVTTAAGEPVVEIAQQGSDLTVSFVDQGSRQSLRGRVRDNGKRKYADSSGAVVIEVKPSDGGFKVRTADGKLLWKIKKSADKIKISDNEENRNPYELKIKEDKTKVYAPVERLLAEVKFYGDRQRVEVKDAGNHELFRATAARGEPFYGVAVLDQIPPRERAIIMAELAVPLR